MRIEGEKEKPKDEQATCKRVCDFFRLAVPTYLSALSGEALTLIIVIFAGQFNNADMIAGVGLASTTNFILCYSILFGCNRPIETFTS